MLKINKKETPTQVFSCEYKETLKNTYFEEHPQTAASVHPGKCKNSRPEVLYEKANTCTEVSFFNIKKVAVWRPTTLLQRNSGTGVFLRILLIFSEDLPLQNICKQLLFEIQLCGALVLSRWRSEKSKWSCDLHSCWTVYPNSNVWDGIFTRKTLGIF